MKATPRRSGHPHDTPPPFAPVCPCPAPLLPCPVMVFLSSTTTTTTNAPIHKPPSSTSVPSSRGIPDLSHPTPPHRLLPAPFCVASSPRSPALHLTAPAEWLGCATVAASLSFPPSLLKRQLMRACLLVQGALALLQAAPSCRLQHKLRQEMCTESQHWLITIGQDSPWLPWPCCRRLPCLAYWHRQRLCLHLHGEARGLLARRPLHFNTASAPDLCHCATVPPVPPAAHDVKCAACRASTDTSSGVHGPNGHGKGCTSSGFATDFARVHAAALPTAYLAQHPISARTHTAQLAFLNPPGSHIMDSLGLSSLGILGQSEELSKRSKRHHRGRSSEPGVVRLGSVAVAICRGYQRCIEARQMAPPFSFIISL